MYLLRSRAISGEVTGLPTVEALDSSLLSLFLLCLVRLLLLSDRSRRLTLAPRSYFRNILLLLRSIFILSFWLRMNKIRLTDGFFGSQVSQPFYFKFDGGQPLLVGIKIVHSFEAHLIPFRGGREGVQQGEPLSLIRIRLLSLMQS